MYLSAGGWLLSLVFSPEGTVKLCVKTNLWDDTGILVHTISGSVL